MNHVKNACSQLQIRFEPVPPKEPSLNEAEKICNFIWAAARAMIISSQAPMKLLPYAVKYAAYIHNRMATTASRKWKTPYEGALGMMPDISKLRLFWTPCYVLVQKEDRRKVRERTGQPLTSQKGHFVGFQTSRSETFAVMLSDNR